MRTYLKCAGALLGACSALLAFTITANAGEYYRGGYYGHHDTPRYSNVWYNSSCCYRKIVRHTRSVHYVHIYRHRQYYHTSHDYYGDRYYRTGYDTTRYYPRSYRDYHHHGGLSYGRARYANYYDYAPRGCYVIRFRVDDGRGGWVWGRRRVCD